MFQSFTEIFSGSSPNKGGTNNVNMQPRQKRGTVKKAEENSESKMLETLKNELKIKDAAIAALSAKVERLESEMLTTTSKRRGRKPIATSSHLINDGGRQKMRMGTRGSILTDNILEAMNEPRRSAEQQIAEKFLQVFQDPVKHMQYIQSEQFANDLTRVSRAVTAKFEEEPRCIFLQSPVYVFGDIHGNLEDLHFFADNIWKMGMDLAAGHFLFLGDYVDRGMSCLEVVAYLFALKLLYPHKISLLRGNHETRDVNGWEQHYQEKSFLYQCKTRFGRVTGEAVWEEVNLAFDRLPLAAVVDHEVFCIHGGLPRPIQAESDDQVAPTEIQTIMSLPSTIAIMPAYEHEEDWMKQVATDCIWSDPASEEMETMLDDSGFGDSPRGGGAVCFGNKAIENFLTNNNLSYIIRAHEAHAYGVSLSKGARVFTVFSTSKDHRQGETAMAGCVLIDNDKIQVINRSPKYKNKYVHRRTSLSVANLSQQELEERRRLGLVRFSIAMDDVNKFMHLHNAMADTADGQGETAGNEHDSEDSESEEYSTTIKPAFG